MRNGSSNKSGQEGPKKTAPKKIGQIINDLMAQRGYAQLAGSAELRKWWTDVVGGMEKFSRAKELKRGVLHVIVSNSVVMQELTFRKQELIDLLRKAKPDQPIKDIRYRLGSIR